MSLPFQAADGGSQTSILISESLVGFMVAATRQNAGRFLYATSPGWRFSEKEADGAKVPGVTDVVIVIAVCGSESLERSSQVVAAIAQVANTKADPVRKV